jgi:hypothetical protein
MSRTGSRLALILAGASILSGCGRGNGLPTDLTRHLAERGIKIVPSRVQAPVSSRGGYIVARYDPQIVTNIIATFKLESVRADDRQWRWAIDRTGGTVAPKELWGVAGRPAQFRLKRGGQFEYFYLLITHDGLMYLIAEYSYG